MPISSMTGFARAADQSGTREWTWEVKSVNARGLETRVRMPSGFDRLEPLTKKAVSKMMSRGTVYAGLTLQTVDDGSSYSINEAALSNAIEWAGKIAQQVDCAPLSADGLMALKGIIEQKDDTLSDEERDKLDDQILATLNCALDDLVKNREQEGGALETVIVKQLDEIQDLANAARANESTSLNFIKGKIEEQLALLLDSEQLPEDRLAQEAALLAVKADIREELDRLDGHVDAARKLLADKDAAGRRLDFLTQELFEVS